MSPGACFLVWVFTVGAMRVGEERKRAGKGVEGMVTGSPQKQPAFALVLYTSDSFLSSSSPKPLDWQKSI